MHGEIEVSCKFTWRVKMSKGGKRGRKIREKNRKISPLRVISEFTDLDLTTFGGASVLAQTARQFGLFELPERAVSVKIQNRGASDVETLWSIIASLARGHGPVSDLDALRADWAWGVYPRCVVRENVCPFGHDGRKGALEFRGGIPWPGGSVHRRSRGGNEWVHSVVHRRHGDRDGREVFVLDTEAVCDILKSSEIGIYLDLSEPRRNPPVPDPGSAQFLGRRTGFDDGFPTSGPLSMLLIGVFHPTPATCRKPRAIMHKPTAWNTLGRDSA